MTRAYKTRILKHDGSIYSTLFIHRLELNVNLGWRNQERSKEQAVLLDMAIKFPTPPAACTTDHLEESSCYATLIEKIRNKIAMAQYHLVEHLSAEIYAVAKTHLPDNTKLTVRLTKYPRISGLTGGVSFHYGDEEIEITNSD
ncbi:MAG: hypothetical protein A3F43_04820 [Gammaproteobacteria bacterium RIFCSPHIGHO2_12_FULL_42_10]|nr:MAG: hypothetical protein A3F43_04820 [Gammaproteobacteria bacterium RIFCSPHIGHO2_12_FULL_42_10]